MINTVTRDLFLLPSKKIKTKAKMKRFKEIDFIRRLSTTLISDASHFKKKQLSQLNDS